MKPVSRTVVLVLSATFCGAAASGLANNFVTPPPAAPVRKPVEPPRPAPIGAPKPLSSAASIASSEADIATPAATPAPTSPAVRVAASQPTYRDGSYTGPLEDAYYGLLRVRLDIQGGRIVDIQVLRYPSDNRTSRRINSLALPYLKSEVIQSQTAYVDMVSGATLSSNAFLRSTYMALRQARS